METLLVEPCKPPTHPTPPLIQPEQPELQEQTCADPSPDDNVAPPRSPLMNTLLLEAVRPAGISLVTACMLVVQWYPATMWVVAFIWNFTSTDMSPSIIGVVGHAVVVFPRVVIIGAAILSVPVGMAYCGFLLALALRSELDPDTIQGHVQRWQEQFQHLRGRVNIWHYNTVMLTAGAALAALEAGLGIGAIRWWHGEAIDAVTKNPSRAALCAFVGHIVAGLPGLLHSVLTKPSSTEAEPADSGATAPDEEYEELKMESGSYESKV